MARVPVLQRPLPVRLKPDQSWDTWVSVAALPQIVLREALTLAHARLSNGAVVRSEPNTNVPNFGMVRDEYDLKDKSYADHQLRPASSQFSEGSREKAALKRKLS
jgi:hypothetical protein